MAKHGDPTGVEYTQEKNGTYTVVFTWDNQDRETVYNVSVDAIDTYEGNQTGLEELYYSVV